MLFATAARRAGAAVGLAVAHYATNGARDVARSEAAPAALRFGLVTDIQYCDVDDAQNYGGTETRFYRGSLEGAKRAADGFREAKSDGGLAFVAQLGDLVDGQNAGGYGAGLKWKGAPNSKKALADVLAAMDGCDAPHFHCVGNHELYNFSPSELVEGPLNRGRHAVAKDGSLYFSFERDGWTFVVLNPYEVSSSLPKQSPGYAAAAALLRAENPNPVLDGPCDFFEGLEGPSLRFVPFNGGLGDAQLAWLAATLEEAGDAPVVVFSHLPVFAGCASWRNVAFDAPEALALLQKAGNVVAVFAGHSHRGGFAVDETGLAHCVVEATLTHETAYAVCCCGADGSLEMVGAGSVPSRDIAAPRRVAAARRR